PSASAAVTLAAGTRLCHLPQPFRLAGGGQLEAPHVALRLSGEPSLPVVAVLGGISADRHVTRPDGRGWWQRFVGPRCAVDSGRYRILSIDWLGGAGESTRATPGFPAIDVADQARALAAVCDALGVASLHAVVGASYGGCVALAFARDHRDRLDRLVVLAAAARARPSAIASRVLQRRIVALGVATGRSGEGLALARALAMTTYRSRRELDARFAAPVVGSSTGYPVVDWLEAQGRRFAARFTADAYLCLSESLDRCELRPAAIGTPATLVGIRGDRVVPAADVEALAAELGGPARYVEIESARGHDGFLTEVEALSPI